MPVQQQQGYIIVKNDTAPALRAYCNQRYNAKEPVVFATINGKWAHVEMDLLTVPNSHTFGRNKVFVERMIDVCEQANGDYNESFLPGCYTSQRRVPAENAETLVQAFFAIYQQTIGQDVPTPSFEHPAPAGKVRRGLEEAIERGYAIARGVADRLPLRYELWCETHHRPYICVWIRREGYAEIRASWKNIQVPNIESVKSRMRAIAEEWNIPHDAQTHRRRYHGGPFLFIRNNELGNIHYLRMEVAEHLARALVRLLSVQKG